MSNLGQCYPQCFVQTRNVDVWIEFIRFNFTIIVGELVSFGNSYSSSEVSDEHNISDGSISSENTSAALPSLESTSAFSSSEANTADYTTTVSVSSSNIPIVSTISLEPTEYTTTVVTTNSDGSFTTETGVVIISTDSTGSWYSSTELMTSMPTEEGSITNSDQFSTYSPGGWYTNSSSSAMDQLSEYTSSFSMNSAVLSSSEAIITSDATNVWHTATSSMNPEKSSAHSNTYVPTAPNLSISSANTPVSSTNSISRLTSTLTSAETRTICFRGGSHCVTVTEMVTSTVTESCPATTEVEVSQGPLSEFSKGGVQSAPDSTISTSSNYVATAISTEKVSHSELDDSQITVSHSGASQETSSLSELNSSSAPISHSKMDSTSVTSTGSDVILSTGTPSNIASPVSSSPISVQSYEGSSNSLVPPSILYFALIFSLIFVHL
ncbi:uncharacterized protein RJT20DRAFT_154214 [Scheffersomyces xylosifermentans]|uniref:uncharacterized protein n=1 Tax=Scheffersomyces xylosifermentans TaxID=1304137 RepID=UPI00315CAD1D